MKDDQTIELPKSSLAVNRRISIPMSEFSMSFVRSSGPGGQNVNKVNTKVLLRWPVVASTALPDDVKQRLLTQFRTRINKAGELVLNSQRYRDQSRNVTDCLEKLREIVALAAVRPKPRKATKPTRASRERRLKQKKQRSEVKQSRRHRPSED